MADPIIGKISVGDGATFTPSVDNAGVLSWSNNKNLTNPASVDLAQAVLDKGLLAPIASPVFTGTPTAPTPAGGDDSTNIATTAYVQAELADYLALSGGTMTGGIAYSGVNVIAKSDDTDEYVEIVGGTSESTGAHISVYGKDNTSKPGNITMEAYDGTNTNSMVLEPTGSAQIGSKEVERVNASGTSYIRFESGLQICWNRVNSVTTSGKAETFPAAFKTGTVPRISIGTATNAVAIGFASLSETGCTFKSASGTQAIDYIAIGTWK